MGTPKSRRSSRAVPMVAAVVAALDRLSQTTHYSRDEDLVLGNVVTGDAYRDEEDAPFYRSRERNFATPENTYAEILRRFTGVVRNGIHAAYRAPQPIQLEDLTGWHRSIFASTFPHQAGVLRVGPSWFGVRWSEDGQSRRRMVEGVAPDRMRDELRAVLGKYNAELRSRPPERRLYREGLTTAADL